MLIRFNTHRHVRTKRALEKTFATNCHQDQEWGTASPSESPSWSSLMAGGDDPRWRILFHFAGHHGEGLVTTIHSQWWTVVKLKLVSQLLIFLAEQQLRYSVLANGNSFMACHNACFYVTLISPDRLICHHGIIPVVPRPFRKEKLRRQWKNSPHQLRKRRHRVSLWQGGPKSRESPPTGKRKLSCCHDATLSAAYSRRDKLVRIWRVTSSPMLQTKTLRATFP